MAAASSNETSSVYVAAWPGAVGVALDINAVYGAPTRAIRIGHGGALAVTRPDGTAVTIPAGPDGETIVIAVSSLVVAASAAYNLLLMF
jgi:hypothetical protein